MGDASDREDIDEWDWRSMLEDDDQDDNEYCTTSGIDDELVTLLLHTCELHQCYNCKYCFTLVISYMPIYTI